MKNKEQYEEESTRIYMYIYIALDVYLAYSTYWLEKRPDWRKEIRWLVLQRRPRMEENELKVRGGVPQTKQETTPYD